MRKSALSCRLLAGLLVSLVPVAPAAAVEWNTWVSPSGSDANSCTRTAPCRTLARAHEQTQPGGTIVMTGSGDFGAAVTIKKSISIVKEGGEGAYFARTDLAAIFIDAGANDVINLRGLIIEGGGGPANSGVVVISAGAVHIQNCVIRGFAGTDNVGLLFAPSTPSELHISDTIIANNGVGTTGGGLLVRPMSQATVVLKRVHVQDNGFGIKLDGTASTALITVNVLDSVSAGNSDAGLVATRNRGPLLNVMIDRSAFTDNELGVYAGGAGAIIRMGNSIVSGNKTGVGVMGGGRLLSYLTNQINGNVSDGAPTGSIVPQ